MIAAQHALHFQTLFEIVSGQNELRGFACGQDTAMIRAFDTAKLRKISAFGETFGDDPAKETGIYIGQ